MRHNQHCFEWQALFELNSEKNMAKIETSQSNREWEREKNLKKKPILFNFAQNINLSLGKYKIYIG